ncbi:hypothetical protein AYL99_10161 [Fonsecaea erecta]|uniref:Uncharacterized protein n=1 Tax=Fonsecaea erecta TaxID=1367422 RepID=A0A178Z898_9EURO|nr:hypothetical protein AYL99_10161 [Fonsecaea erecta]OAP56009.1 hypothetical protein AYL99_10161 [Fonsecaea erecta]
MAVATLTLFTLILLTVTNTMASSTTETDIAFSYPGFSLPTSSPVGPASTAASWIPVDSSPYTSTIGPSYYSPSIALSVPSYLPSFASSSDTLCITTLVSALSSTRSSSLPPPVTCPSSIPGAICSEGPQCSNNTTITISITSTSYVTTILNLTLTTSSPGALLTHSASIPVSGESCHCTEPGWENVTSSIVVSTAPTTEQPTGSGLGYPTPVTLPSAGSTTASNSGVTSESIPSSSETTSASSNSNSNSNSESESSSWITLTGPITQSQAPSPTITSHSSAGVTSTTITTHTSPSTSTSTSTTGLPAPTGGARSLEFQFEAIIATCLLGIVWGLVFGL